MIGILLNEVRAKYEPGTKETAGDHSLYIVK